MKTPFGIFHPWHAHASLSLIYSRKKCRIPVRSVRQVLHTRLATCKRPRPVPLPRCAYSPPPPRVWAAWCSARATHPAGCCGVVAGTSPARTTHVLGCAACVASGASLAFRCARPRPPPPPRVRRAVQLRGRRVPVRPPRVRRRRPDVAAVRLVIQTHAIFFGNVRAQACLG